MKKYSQEEALNEIFNKKGLSPIMIVNRSRYKKNQLSQKFIDNLLKKHNFVIVHISLYKRLTTKNKCITI
jgi:hypothetical protein